MKNVVVNSSLNFIKKNYSYDEVKLAELKYGLEGIYILISKSVVIFMVAIILGIFKEVLIFSCLYSLIRMPSFGLHATKSWICLVSSLISFITIPYICVHLTLSIYIKGLLNIISILLMFKNSPADTYKRPIVSKKRRDTYKTISVMISITMAFISLFINNNFLSNALIFALLLQNIMISPITYKIFKLPYNNYKKYLNVV